MSTGGATPPAAAAPGLLRSLATSLAGPLLTAALLVGYYERFLKPAPPAPPALATLLLDYRKGQPAALRRTAAAIRSKSLATVDAANADLAAHGKAVGDERSRLLKACSDDKGALTDPTTVAAALEAAADLIEGKTTR